MGIGFVNIFGDPFTFDEHREAAQQGLALAREKISRAHYQLVILDEILGAVDQGQVDLEQVLELIADEAARGQPAADRPRCPEAVPGSTAAAGGPGDRDGEAEAPVRRGAPGAQGTRLLMAWLEPGRIAASAASSAQIGGAEYLPSAGAGRGCVIWLRSATAASPPTREGRPKLAVLVLDEGRVGVAIVIGRPANRARESRPFRQSARSECGRGPCSEVLGMRFGAVTVR